MRTLINLALLFFMMFNSFGQTDKLFPIEKQMILNSKFEACFIATKVDNNMFSSNIDGDLYDFHILKLKDDTKIESIINTTNVVEMIVVSRGKVEKIVKDSLLYSFPMDSVSLIAIKFSSATRVGGDNYFNILVSKPINTGMSFGDEIKQNDFSVYPNPTTTGDITIELSEPSKFIEIFNQTGQLIRRIENPDTNIQTTLENKGIYFIRTDSGVAQKLIYQ